MAGVIFVGHGHDGEDAYGDVYDYVHHSPLRLGASIRRGKASLPAAFRDVAPLVAGLRGASISLSTGGGTRTLKTVRSVDFESTAFAIPPLRHIQFFSARRSRREGQSTRQRREVNRLRHPLAAKAVAVVVVVAVVVAGVISLRPGPGPRPRGRPR